MPASSGNLFEAAPEDVRKEHAVCLVETRHVRIERIVSTGQASPPGFWYDQPWAEWVVVLAGSAGLRFEGEAEVKVLSEGDYVLIPARLKHRFEWTSQDQATIWLKVNWTPFVGARGLGCKVESRLPLSFKNQAASCCFCWGYVGNAFTLSKRSGISTALCAAAILSMPARHAAIGIGLFIA
jgi:cupin 2 domain-containing protein